MQGVLVGANESMGAVEGSRGSRVVSGHRDKRRLWRAGSD